jgi:antitoxin (DNA-binding transcriptional repressor) of toxin-antitoxin stability system
MKTASVLDLPEGLPAILLWLQEGETVLLLEQNGTPVGRIVPEPKPALTKRGSDLKALFAKRFAPLDHVFHRDLSGVVSENRGDR